MIKRFPHIDPRQQISAAELNRLMREAERLTNITASPPLRISRDAGGYNLGWDKIPEIEVFRIVNPMPDATGAYDGLRCVIRIDYILQKWAIVDAEKIWILDPNTLPAGSFLP